jgi:hypothetical protein
LGHAADGGASQDRIDVYPPLGLVHAYRLEDDIEADLVAVFKGVSKESASVFSRQYTFTFTPSSLCVSTLAS